MLVTWTREEKKGLQKLQTKSTNDWSVAKATCSSSVLNKKMRMLITIGKTSICITEIKPEQCYCSDIFIHFFQSPLIQVWKVLISFCFPFFFIMHWTEKTVDHVTLLSKASKQNEYCYNIWVYLFYIYIIYINYFIHITSI